ncbi:MAG: transporter [Hyalangium sp.]|uniref:transporter n=1 Tax=Hyalangium sp. TaxID=2028555 RepID=UPI0038998850
MSGPNVSRPTTTPRPLTPAAPPPAQDSRVTTSTNVSPTKANASFGYDSGSAFEASTSGTLPGGVQAEAHASGPSLKVDGNANAKVGPGGIDVNVSVDIDATAVKAGASATKTFQVDVAGKKLDVTVDLSAAGAVGADGKLNLNLHIGTDGNVTINAGAQGFAGARGALTGGVTVSHDGKELAKGSVELSATAGVGFNAHANLELKDGGLNFDVGAEATATAGFGVDVKGNVNGANTVKFLGEVLGGLAGQGVKWAGDELKNVSHWAGDRFQDVKSFIDHMIPDIHLPDIHLPHF